MNPPVSRLFLHERSFRSSAKIRLFCFPYAGVGASLYREWEPLFPPEIEVCPVQLPGRESRFTEEAFDQIQPLVNWLGEELCPYLQQPYAFFGHSMGTLIAFELAHYFLQQAHRLPECLFISAYWAPHLSSLVPPIAQLPEERFLAELYRLGGISTAVFENKAFLRLLLPALRADFTLSEAYQCQHHELLPCPLALFGGLDDQRVRREELLAWQTHTRSSCSVKFFPGGHFFLQSCQAALVRAICDVLLPSTEQKRA